jgi:hypothetical protein
MDKLESEVEELRSWAALGNNVAKTLFELANPILILSGKLELISRKMHVYERMMRVQRGHSDELKRTMTEFEKCRQEVDDMLREYKSISVLAQIGGDERETLERKLERYH